jgi:TetR/AcrR family transcriptional repressor of nem operon
MAAQTTLSHRERLLREGTKLLFAVGYHGTTVDGILEAAGVPKGSFYHHFGSKEAFALEALGRYQRFQHDLLARWSEKSGLSTADAVVGYFEEMAGAFVRSRHQRGCLVGKLSSETAASSTVFRRALAEYVRDWKAQLVELLGRGITRGDVRADMPVEQLADTVLALIQGVFVMGLAVREQSILTSVSTALRVLITQPPTNSETTTKQK